MALSLSFRRRANAKLTLYNMYVDPTTKQAVWQRTEIVNSDNALNSIIWAAHKTASIRNAGLVEANKVYITIPRNLGTNYLEPVAWQALSVKTGKWTLQEGDIVVKGIVTDEIIAGFTASMLIAKYEFVMKINETNLIDQGPLAFQHWYVGAK